MKIKYFDSSGTSKTEVEEEFFNKYTGVSLLIDPDENAGEQGYSEKQQIDLLHLALPYLALLAFLLSTGYFVLSDDGSLDIPFIQIGLFITKIIGLSLSLLLVLKDLNINSSLADILCGTKKKLIAIPC